jgi:hypothetical protein
MSGNRSGEYQTTEESKAGTDTTPKDIKKVALKPEKEAKIEVVETTTPYPTVATGNAPEKEKLTYTSRVADFYREGTVNENGSIQDFPRTIEPYAEQSDTAPYTASIRIYGKPKGTTVATDLIPAYTKFILSSVQESQTERSQIVETFGDFYVFMFGQRPSMYNFSGLLVNTKSSSWVTDFMYMYDQYLRGTKCVEQNAVAIISYGGRQVEGLILSTANQTDAATESGVPFQFSVVVFERRYYNFSEDMGYSLDSKGKSYKDTKFREALNKVAGKTGKDTSKPKISAAINKTNSAMRGRDPVSEKKGTLAKYNVGI